MLQVAYFNCRNRVFEALRRNEKLGSVPGSNQFTHAQLLSSPVHMIITRLENRLHSDIIVCIHRVAISSYLVVNLTDCFEDITDGMNNVRSCVYVVS